MSRGSSLTDELRDPWSLVVGALAGGLAWALGVPVLLAIVVGLVVYGVKAATASALSGPDDDGRSSNRLPRPPEGSAAAYFLARAEAAVESLRQLVRTPEAGPTAGQAAGVADQARTTLDDLRRLGAQATAVETAMLRVDTAGLVGERTRLEAQQRALTDPAVRLEVDRALATVREQEAVAARLSTTRDNVLARMQSSALGLEGLVARLAEVLALVDTTGGVDDASRRIGELAGELDGLRAGLAETEALSRRVLGVAGPEAAPA